MTASYLPGNGDLKVGDRVRYIGKRSGLLNDVAVGTEARVAADLGYDYRYMLVFDHPVLVYAEMGRPYERMDTGIRTSSGGWEKI